MYSFRKSKKGFTLIELMVVVAIIAVLALLGLRMYTSQQNKAKEALVKANAGTVQVAIQTALVESTTADVELKITTGAPTVPVPEIDDLSVLQNPFTGATGIAAAPGGAVHNADLDPVAYAAGTAVANMEGMVGVYLSDSVFYIDAYGKGGRYMDYQLRAQK